MPSLQHTSKVCRIIPMDVHEVIDFGAMALKQRAYSVTTKLQAIEEAEKSSKEAAANRFGMYQVCVGSIHAVRVSRYDPETAYSMKVF